MSYSISIKLREIKNVENWDLFIKAVATFPVFATTRTNYDSEMKNIISEYMENKDILDEVGAVMTKLEIELFQ